MPNKKRYKLPEGGGPDPPVYQYVPSAWYSAWHMIDNKYILFYFYFLKIFIGV